MEKHNSTVDEEVSLEWQRYFFHCALLVGKFKVTGNMMQGVWCFAVLWIITAGTEAQNRSRNRLQQGNPVMQNNRRSPFKSWNSQMYPVWKGSEAQKRDCWKGGQVTFNLQNDAPTLTGAKATFFIQLNFPRNQTVLPDGQVIWAQNCTDNGTWVPSGEPVYPNEGTEGAECTFPDGQAFPRDSEKRRSKFVYVWLAWGKYWQVVDGPSSNLTVDTDGIPLGSYTMEVVVYHYRGRQKFIPIGSTNSQFTVTDQIPVSVSISQVLDVNQTDKRYIQNRAMSFSVAVHDPSNYLQGADISFSWDFGDQSGTLITRNTGVTHTYVTPGIFKAKVVVQAAIPTTPCGSPAPVVTTEQEVATTEQSPAVTTEGVPATTNGGQGTVAPSGTSATTNSTQPADVVITVASLNEENVESDSAPELNPVIGSSAMPENDAQEATVAGNEVAATLPGAEATEATDDNQETTPGDMGVMLPEIVATQTGETGTEPEVSEESVSTDAVLTELSPSAPSQVMTDLVAATEMLPAAQTEGQVLLLAKRQAAEGPVGCLIYRYGTFASDLEIVSGIESVQIVQVEPIVAAGLVNTVDLTITCQGSVPTEVCTVISDPECENPQQTVCNPVEPSSDCQLVLRQVFNNTGIYCVNISLADDVSLAVASAQVSVLAGAASSVNGIAVTVGVLLVAFAVATVAYTYRRLKSYTPLRTEHSLNWFPDRSSLRIFIQSALGRSSGENSPLLNGRVV